jgi:hypothetical protein
MSIKQKVAISEINHNISPEEDEIVNKIIEELNNDDNINNNNQSKISTINTIQNTELPNTQQHIQQVHQTHSQQPLQQVNHIQQPNQHIQQPNQHVQQPIQQIHQQQPIHQNIQQDLQQNIKYPNNNDKNKLLNIFNTNIKDIIFIVVLSFILYQPLFDNILKSLKIDMILFNNNLNNYGLILKCLILAILYYIYKYMS